MGKLIEAREVLEAVGAASGRAWAQLFVDDAGEGSGVPRQKHLRAGHMSSTTPIMPT